MIVGKGPAASQDGEGGRQEKLCDAARYDKEAILLVLCPEAQGVQGRMAGLDSADARRSYRVVEIRFSEAIWRVTSASEDVSAGCHYLEFAVREAADGRELWIAGFDR